MSTAAKQARYTAEEYLKLERAAEFKSEFVDGQIYAMAGVSFRHCAISSNLMGSLKSWSRGRDCIPIASDLRVAIEPTGLYTYPDLVIVCGPPRLIDDQFDTLLNPTVVIEILSPSTESWDRGGKFGHYRRIESLREYVLVAQDRARVECRAHRQDEWVVAVSEGIDGVLRLASIGCEIGLREIYDGIALDPPRPS